MNIEFILKEDLFVLFSGELDHIAARENRERLEMKTATTPSENIVLDLEGLSFMDSSGISLIYNIYKTASSVFKKVFVVTSNEKFKTILRLAGMQEFVEIVSEYVKGKKGGYSENGNN